MRLNYWQSDDGKEKEEGITVSCAKQLLREKGGIAWTEHCERDGGVFEITEIRLSGNNSRFQYNHHL